MKHLGVLSGSMSVCLHDQRARQEWLAMEKPGAQSMAVSHRAFRTKLGTFAYGQSETRERFSTKEKGYRFYFGVIDWL